MIQELFHIGSFSISPFGVMLVAALLTAYWQLLREMRRLGIGNDDDASSVVVACGLGGIVGGKIYYAILYRDWHLIYDRAGIVWYGCFVAGLAMLLWTMHRRRLPMAKTFDATAPALALGYGVGRIGCFLVGDDYGRPTDLPWGTVFKVGLPPTQAFELQDKFGLAIPPGVAPTDWVAVHPTQVYETLLAILIWGLLLRFRKGERQPGSVFLLAVSLLALERFGIEFLRAKDDRFFGDFTLAQVISAVILVAVAFVAWRRRSRG